MTGSAANSSRSGGPSRSSKAPPPTKAVAKPLRVGRRVVVWSFAIVVTVLAIPTFGAMFRRTFWTPEAVTAPSSHTALSPAAQRMWCGDQVIALRSELDHGLITALESIIHQGRMPGTDADQPGLPPSRDWLRDWQQRYRQAQKVCEGPQGPTGGSASFAALQFAYADYLSGLRAIASGRARPTNPLLGMRE